MESLEEKKSHKVENSKQTLMIVMVIFIVFLAFLAGVLTSLLIMEKADQKNDRSNNIENVDQAGEGENSFVTYADMEKMEEEIKEDILNEVMKEIKESASVKTDSNKTDSDEIDVNKTDTDNAESDKTDISQSNEEKDDAVSKISSDKSNGNKNSKNKTNEQSHRYELIVEDITWTEAEQSCKDKGGYLVTITSKEEFELLTKQIVDEKKTKISFFIGATRDENYVNHSSGVIAYHWVHDGSDIDLYDEETKEFWLADEPSFYGRKADGSKLDEQYVDMIYREADKRCYFNDVADDILAQVPSFSGSVGYICEYDE
ncbi:MAG: C-type lectin domain-containing protein [Lachnospiraceae bacterium]